jgi:hydrogenase-4 component B
MPAASVLMVPRRCPETAKLLVFVLAFIGFGSKAGVFPFHVWLPHAHPAAPSHISAIMSGVMIKCGIYGILSHLRILGLARPFSGYIVLVAGMISGILGVVYASASMTSSACWPITVSKTSVLF